MNLPDVVSDGTFSVAHWSEYLALCKLKIVSLIVFTAIVGMFLSVPGMVPLDILFFGTLGIGLAAAAAAAVNHIVDQRVDSAMARTRLRPLVKGNISSQSAILFAFTLGLLAMVILAWLVNVLTAVLTLFSLIGYGFIYSMWLKRASPQNITIGGAAGAAPPVLGWTAVTGALDPNSLMLFLIIFAWTPPHFWSLAVYRCEEYRNVKIPMLPVTHGADHTRLHILLYTLVLFIVTLLPFITLMSGPLYLLGAVALGFGFIWFAVRLWITKSDRVAMKTFSYSIFYLIALFAFILVDHYVPYLTAKPFLVT